jgi:uncharacterized protein
MKKLLLILVLAVMCSSVARANDFYDGLDVVKKNEFNQYLEMWKSEVQQLKPTTDRKKRFVGYIRAYDPLAKKEHDGTLKSAVWEQYDIGVKYYNGDLVKLDYKKAMWWWRLAAEQGNNYAQYELAKLYMGKEGANIWIPMDQDHEKAAEVLYTDHKEAAKWFLKAAKQGQVESQIRIADMYKDGIGVIQDYKEAVKWYRKAAARNITRVQNSLGIMYANGEGVIQDYVLAHMWFNLSGSGGIKEGRDNRDSIAKEMTPAQIAEAQKLARECLKKNYKNCD